MKKVWDFFKPTVFMLASFILAVLLPSVFFSFVIDRGSISDFTYNILTLVLCLIFVFFFGIFIDKGKSKYGFVMMIIIMIAFGVITIISDETILLFISLVGNWAFSSIRQIWYHIIEMKKMTGFSIEYNWLINLTSILASVIIVPSFLLLGSLLHKEK